MAWRVPLTALVTIAAMVLRPLGFPRGSGSLGLALALLTVMFGLGLAVFFSGLGRSDRELLVEFVRRELGLDLVDDDAKPPAAGDGAAAGR